MGPAGSRDLRAWQQGNRAGARAPWDADNLLSSVPSLLFYSILLLTGYNRCIAPPDSAVSGSAGSGYAALGHTPVQTRSGTILIASVGPQGKVESSCLGHPT